MKVLHINTNQEGGAAWCAKRINNALRQQGVESKMLFAEGECVPKEIEGDIATLDRIVSVRSYWLFNKIRNLAMRLPWYMNVKKMSTLLDAANTEGLYVHQPLSNYTNIVRHPLVKWADIIHLHWVPDFIDYPTFFQKVKKPVIWTLHDMYPAIGVMHFESEYSKRNKELDEIDKICRKIKQKGLSKASNLHIVAISEMMKDIIASSDLLKSFPISLIHNGVDTTVFKPLPNKHSIISEFAKSLKDGTKIFLFSSCNIWDRRKGFDRIIEALENVKTKTKRDIALVAVGANLDKIIPSASFPIFWTGLIRDQHEIAKLYSSADYFINASYEEAFAQTPLEAMACGTPVISSPCSGAKDLIRPFNGIICSGYDSDAIEQAINNAMSMQYDSNAIRKYIFDNYDYSIIAKEYISLYNNVLHS